MLRFLGCCGSDYESHRLSWEEWERLAGRECEDRGRRTARRVFAPNQLLRQKLLLRGRAFSARSSCPAEEHSRDARALDVPFSLSERNMCSSRGKAARRHRLGNSGRRGRSRPVGLFLSFDVASTAWCRVT